MTGTILSEDRCILHVDDPNWAVSHGLVRDFRACTHTVAVGPALYAMRGPAALQSMLELGAKLIANLNLFGTAPELEAVVLTLIREHRLRGVTLAGSLPALPLSSAAAAANAGQQSSGYVRPPQILGVLMPISKSRNREIRRIVDKCRAAGLHGLLVEFDDLAVVRRVWPEALILTPAQRPPRDVRKGMNPRLQRLPGITEVLAGGADHVVMPHTLLNISQAEWQADMAHKEVTDVYPPEQGEPKWE